MPGITNFKGLSDVQVELEAQRTAEIHLAACDEGLDNDDPGGTIRHPATGAYCGCLICVVREVLYAAWPAFTELARRAVAKEVD